MNSIESLLGRYRELFDASRSSEQQHEAFSSLRIAAYALKRHELLRRQPDLPLQLAVLGPTQSGKSSLVNLFLDSNDAGVSALAGYTVHAQGFALNLDGSSLQQIGTLLAPATPIAKHQLDADKLDHFVLEPVRGGTQAMLQQGVVWDTPDFDSVAAQGYREAVLALAGLADVLVLALSKDKYADRTVWELLAHLRALDKPLLVCLNKLETPDRATVINAFSTRFSNTFGAAPPPLITLPWRAQHEPLDVPSRQTLAAALQRALAEVDRERERRALQSLIDARWSDWLAPIEREAAAEREWHTTVTQQVDAALQRYSELYLDDPQHYDAFNRTLAELLVLLEIPVLAPVLERTRAVITWPARALLDIGRKASGHQQHPAANTEADVLKLIAEQLQARLREQILASRDDEAFVWWRALDARFRSDSASIEALFQARAEQYQQDFRRVIEDSAQALHAELKQQPALLNSLRAARASADAASIALAVKTGGLAPHDLVLAPAMLSISSLLTESALGRYVDKVKQSLRRQQREAVRQDLLIGVLQQRYLAMAEAIDRSQLYGSELAQLEPPRIASA